MLSRTDLPNDLPARSARPFASSRALGVGKLILMLAMAVFVTASVYEYYLIKQRQITIERTARFNVSWLASQAALELERFVERLSSYEVDSSEVGADEVQLRFSILQGRADIFRHSELEKEISSDATRAETAEMFFDALKRMEPYVADLSKPGNDRKARTIALPLEARMTQLAASLFQQGGEEENQDQKDVTDLQTSLGTMAIGIIGCSLTLGILMLWHNRTLAKAHRESNLLASTLQRTSGHLNTALDNMSHGLCLADNQQRLVICNKQFLDLFGIPPHQAVTGSDIVVLMNGEEGSRHERETDDALKTPFQRLIGKDEVIETRSGRFITISQRSMATGGWIATFEDITEKRDAEARIAYLAHYDTVTNLPNRAFFGEQLEHALGLAESNGAAVTVLLLDLDRFKAVNDTFGHPAGDHLLRCVAHRLLQCLQAGDMAARLGGDEFIVLQVGQQQPQAAEALARRLTAVITAPYALEGGKEATVGVSIGIAGAGSNSAEDLLKSADLALYKAKAGGRGNYRFFNPEMDSERQSRRVLELAIRQAMERSEFSLQYQALVDLECHRVVGFEALLRWRHPTLGMVSPSVFIPIAEEIGMIWAIGEWVLHQACLDAMCWPDAIKVAVNLSAAQFRLGDLRAVVESALSNSGLPASRLELEITESVILTDNETTLKILHDLRSAGTSVALDDFGTGYASLSYLRSFPFDRIKIDRQFIRDSARPDCLAIIGSIASLARQLQMATTAEGIETIEQLDRAKTAGCTVGQGYLFARPRWSHELEFTWQNQISAAA